MPLNKEQVLEGIKKLRGLNVKRKFTQSIDFQLTLKDTDVTKPENKIKEYVILPHIPGKKFSIAGFVGKELMLAAKEVFDESILQENFKDYTDKKKIKELIGKHDFFVAQANLMGEIAQYFGKYLGPRGKMPDPKSGCVVPPKNELLKPLYDKLQKTILLRIKDQPIISSLIGNESMKDEDIAENIIHVYNAIKAKLPRGEEQIKNARIKMTMSRSVIL